METITTVEAVGGLNAKDYAVGTVLQETSTGHMWRVRKGRRGAMDFKRITAVRGLGLKAGEKSPAAAQDTVEDHRRFSELYRAWQDRDFEADNFELHLELVSMCERCGWAIPADLK